MKKFIILCLGLSAIIATSCIKDSGNDTGVRSDGFTVNFSLPTNIVTNYATVPVEAGEDEASSLYMFFFEESSGRTGRFIEMYDASPTDGNPYKSFGTIDIRFQSGSLLNTNTAYNILMVANLDHYINGTAEAWADELIGKTENEVINTITLVVEGANTAFLETDDTQNIDPADIPMAVRFTKSATSSNMYVDLERIVSRFDVTNNALANSGYSLESVSIWNAFPETSIWGSGADDFGTRERIKRYYGIKNISGEEIKGGLYAFENKVTRPEFDDLMTTCLIVGLHDGTETSYYRVNIHPTGQGQFLLRNNVYQLTINDVLSKGASSEEDAYTSRETNLDYNINGWVIDNSGNVITDGNNILAVPSTKVVFNPLGGIQEFNIFTYGDGALEVADYYLPDGITYTLVNRLLTITATASEDTKDGYLELKFGTLRAHITIEQTGATEKFLNLSTYDIPNFPFEAGKAMTGNITVSASGNWTAQLINVSTENFTFTAGSLVKEWTSTMGDSFSLVTFSSNPDPSQRYSIVKVFLDDDIEIQRTLVLTQNGTGDITVTPLNDVTFEHDMTTTDNTHFSVNAGGSEWEVYMTGDNPNRFDYTMDGDGNGFTVSAAATNTGSTAYKATVRVRLKAVQTTYKEILLEQKAQVLTVTPGSTQVSWLGVANSQFTVTASGPWTVTIPTSTVSGVTFHDGSTTYTGVAGTHTFSVKFPKNFKNATPSATVTVQLDGTSLSRNVTLEQQKPTVIAVQVKTHEHGGYGSLSSTSNHYIGQMSANMRNSSYFGPSATAPCYTNGFTFNSGTSPDAQTNIFQFNSGGYTNASTIGNWTRSSDKNILFLCGDLALAGKCSGLGYSNLVGVTSTGTTNHKTINPSLTIDNSKIIRFLLADGPFTEGGAPITPSSVSVRPNDGTHGSLSQWPNTMECIMYNSNPSYSGHCLLGIDPTLGIIFCGDTEIFHNAQSASGNYTSVDGANMKFLNNLIAFMCYAAQYGDDFLEDYR